jgi:hypothetical protein
VRGHGTLAGAQHIVYSTTEGGDTQCRVYTEFHLQTTLNQIEMIRLAASNFPMCIVDNASYRGTNHASSAVEGLRRLGCVGVDVFTGSVHSQKSLQTLSYQAAAGVRVKSEQNNTALIVMATDGEGARRLLMKLLQGSDL